MPLFPITPTRQCAGCCPVRTHLYWKHPGWSRRYCSQKQDMGIRVPDNKICLSLVTELGHPLINTSAKLEQDETLSDPFEIERKFKHSVNLVIDGGILASGQSSVISLIDDMPQVLRAGKGDVEDFL